MGLSIARAAISNVLPDEFLDFVDQHNAVLRRNSEEHLKSLEEWMHKAGAKYQWIWGQVEKTFAPFPQKEL